MNIDELILKILEQKNDSELEEIKVDLSRICVAGFGNDKFDLGYIDYLYKHYNKDIQVIYNVKSALANSMDNIQVSKVINIRNYLIKIAIIRICSKKGIQCEIQKMDDINYCMGLLN